LVVSKVEAVSNAARMYVSGSVVIGSGVQPCSLAVGSTYSLAGGPLRESADSPSLGVESDSDGARTDRFA
jgi:hypothetical protein